MENENNEMTNVQKKKGSNLIFITLLCLVVGILCFFAGKKFVESNIKSNDNPTNLSGSTENSNDLNAYKLAKIEDFSYQEDGEEYKEIQGHDMDYTLDNTHLMIKGYTNEYGYYIDILHNGSAVINKLPLDFEYQSDYDYMSHFDSFIDQNGKKHLMIRYLGTTGGGYYIIDVENKELLLKTYYGDLSETNKYNVEQYESAKETLGVDLSNYLSDRQYINNERNMISYFYLDEDKKTLSLINLIVKDGKLYVKSTLVKSLSNINMEEIFINQAVGTNIDYSNL